MQLPFMLTAHLSPTVKNDSAFASVKQPDLAKEEWEQQSAPAHQGVNNELTHQPLQVPDSAGNTNAPGISSSFSDISLHAASPVSVQPKLSVNTPGDEYEQEADEMADKIMRMSSTAGFSTAPVPPDNIQRKCAQCEEEEKKHQDTAPGVGEVIQRKCAKCEEEEKNKLQRKEFNRATPAVSGKVQQVLQSTGQPLDRSTRSFMEQRFGFNFGQVQIHNNSLAHQSANDINAKAYTYRQNIVFGAGQYQPDTEAGKRLLAHELTHVVQQGGSRYLRNSGNAAARKLLRKPLAGEMIQRDPVLTAADNEVLLNPVNGKVTASVFMGLEFSPADPKQTYREGAHKYIQGISAIIKALAGQQYIPDLVTEYITEVGGESSLTHYGGTGSIAGVDEKIESYFLRGDLPGLLIQFFDKKKIPFPADLREILQSYYDIDRLYEAISFVTPKWFTRDLLAGLVLSKKTWLTKYAELDAKEKRDEDTGNEYSAEYYGKLEQYVFFYIDIAEAIRMDKALLEEPAYAMLWNLPVNTPDAKIKISASMAGRDYIDIINAMRLFQQCDTDIADAKKAAADNAAGHTARLKLLKDAMSIPLNGQSAKANTKLSDRLNRYNAPAFPATLQSYPPLEPPLFELVSGTAPTFSMSVEWGDFYDALGFAFAGSYGFELIRISDSVIQNLIKLKEGQIGEDTSAKAKEEMNEVTKVGEDKTIRGETPTIGGVIGQKFGTRVDYFAEDIETVFDGIGVKYGVEAGMGILTLDAVGNAFGAIGDVISSFWEDINADRWEKKIPIQKPGLYIIRATAFQRDIPENAVYVHAPSVAWMPVWARAAEDYSTKYLEQVLAGRERAQLQLEELDKKLLPGVQLTAEERKSIKDNRDTINTFLHGTVAEQLAARKKKVEDALDANPDKDTKELLEKQKKEVERLIQIQKTRTLENTTTGTGLEPPFTLPAIFVSDKGPTTRLYMELIEQPRTNNKYNFFVSDLTSSKMSSRTGPEKDTREEAIEAAILEYLMQPNRYGKGYCSISIPAAQGTQGSPVKRTFRVKSDEAGIVIDSIENIASALTIILIAAAPFTGGTSLALLLPVGIVGAIPSAYRLYDRAKGDSFYLDWGTAMDIVNVVASFAGVGGKAASGLKLVTVAKGFAIVGLGLDGLGVVVGTAKTMEDIDSISKRTDISPGTKRAMIMSSVGGQLASIGLTIGTRVYETGQLMEKSTIEESKSTTPKPPVQENGVPGKEQGKTPVVTSGDPVPVTPDNTLPAKPAVTNEPEVQTPKTTAPVTPADPVPVTPDNTVPAKPAVTNEPEVQTPKTTAPVTPADPVPVTPDNTVPAKPAVTNEPEVQTPKTTAPVTPADPVPVTPDNTVPAKPAVTNEPEVQTPKTTAPVTPADPVPVTPDNKLPVKPAVTNEPEVQKPKTPASVTPEEPLPATPEKKQPAVANEPETKSTGTPSTDTPQGAKPPAAGKKTTPKKTTKKKTGAEPVTDEPGSAEQVAPADKAPSKGPSGTDETTVKPAPDETVPAQKEGTDSTDKPVTEETPSKKPVEEEGKANDTDGEAQTAKPATEENPIDKKIAAAEAQLSAAKQKQKEVSAKMQELKKIVENEVALRNELLDRLAKSADPAEKKALTEQAKESKRRQDKAVEEHNELFDEAGGLSADVSDLEKQLKALKDIKTDRVQDDIDVDPTPPKANDGDGKIGTTPNQDTQLHADVLDAKANGATDIRVNQQQVDASGKRVGTNRPDLQYTLNGQRYYIEYEHPGNPRGDDHTKRILSNDQNGIVQVKLVPDTPGFTPGKGVVILTKP